MGWGIARSIIDRRLFVTYNGYLVIMELIATLSFLRPPSTHVAFSEGKKAETSCGNRGNYSWDCIS